MIWLFFQLCPRVLTITRALSEPCKIKKEGIEPHAKKERWNIGAMGGPQEGCPLLGIRLLAAGGN